MNTVPKSIIEYMIDFITIKDIESSRQSCRVLNDAMRRKYYNVKIFDMNHIHIKRFLLHVEKYDLCVNLKNVQSYNSFQKFKKCRLGTIELGVDFNTRILNILIQFKHLRELKLNKTIQSTVPKKYLPVNLQSLEIDRTHYHLIDQCILPHNLQKLILRPRIFCNLNDRSKSIDLKLLPRSLKELHLGDIDNVKLKKDYLPEGLIHLVLTYTLIRDIRYLPPNLETLFLSHQCCTLGTFLLPSTLTILGLGRLFTQPFEAITLPKNLKILYVEQRYFESIEAMLPPTLKTVVYTITYDE
jgi:hypothetical protein